MNSRLNARPSQLAVLLATAATLTALPLARGQNFIQGPVRNPANGNVYFKLSPAAWGNCENFANILLGAHLITINDAAENAWVLNTFSAPLGHALWIGLNDFAVEGSHVWSSGETSAYRNWAAGQPDNAGGLEDYVHMLGNGQWNDNQNAAASIYGVVEVPCNISILETGINFETGTTYRLLSPSSWSCAEMYARDVLSSHLVTINDADENAFVRSTFVVNHTNPRVWLGLNDFATEGTYVWADGSTSAFRNWYPGEPNNNGNQDFVVMYLGGEWDDVKDVENGAAVGPTGGLVENSCGTISIEAGPLVNPANGHTYYRLSPATWSCAEVRARAMGGHLASINNAAENEFIRSNFVTGSAVAAFGLNDYTTEGTYVNMNGDAVSYTNWAVGQPSGTNPDADFAVMSSTGAWSSIPNIVPFDVEGIVELPFIINDVCANKILLGTGSTSVTFTNINAGTDGPFEPACFSASGPDIVGDVWFLWQAGASQRVVMTTCSGTAGFDTKLGVYAGSRCPTLPGTIMVCNDNAQCSTNELASRVSFVATAGSFYSIRVGGSGSSRGVGTLSIGGFCPADVDDGSGTGTPDGGVTIDDLLYYLDQFAQGTTRADLDDGSGTGTPDGGVTIDDLLYFLLRFESGC
jgi:hypothetical protein